MKKLFEIILHLFWPINCQICSRPAVTICDDCLSSLMPTEETSIQKLDKLKIYTASIYNRENIRKIIFALKYYNYRSLGRILGIKMSELFEKPEIDYLIPVPLHIDSERYFNQSFEIARGLGYSWGIKVIDAAKWTRIVPRRVGLTASERKSLELDAFTITKNIKGMKIALVDDVCTTGTTLLRLAQACEKSGAEVSGAYALAGTLS